MAQAVRWLVTIIRALLGTGRSQIKLAGASLHRSSHRSTQAPASVARACKGTGQPQVRRMVAHTRDSSMAIKMLASKMQVTAALDSHIGMEMDGRAVDRAAKQLLAAQMLHTLRQAMLDMDTERQAHSRLKVGRAAQATTLGSHRCKAHSRPGIRVPNHD